MKRYQAWMAMGVMMLGGAAALAQQPNGLTYPMLPRYPATPGYPYAYPPLAPYAPGAPLAPVPPGAPYAPVPPGGPNAPMPPIGAYGYPTPPNGYGNQLPLPIPPDPRLPKGQRGPSLPGYVDGVPNGGPTEPYYVQPDGPQNLPRTKPETPKPAPIERFVQLVTATDPSEPYTTYEGPRYPSEARNDNTRTWIRANYIHWWVRGDSTPPLVTTGNPGALVPGILGNADTITLLGNGDVSPRQLSGMQATIGMWLDPEHWRSLEIGGVFLGRVTRTYHFASDAGGSLPLAQPVLIGGAEAALITAQPGVFAGAINVSSSLDFHGFDMIFNRNAVRLDNWSLDWLIGFRYLYLNDNLEINQNLTVLPGGANLISFNNVPQPAGTSFTFSDSFAATNRFYGGTIGARVGLTWCRFDIDAAFRLSMGVTHHVVNIGGTTTLVGGDTISGSSLAQASNIRRYSSSEFSVIPELTTTLGYQLTPHLRFLLGYAVLDWNRIQRAGSQIDRNLDLTQVPTSATFVPGTVGTAPVFPKTRTDFWAQGINVGFEWKY